MKILRTLLLLVVLVLIALLIMKGARNSGSSVVTDPGQATPSDQDNDPSLDTVTAINSETSQLRWAADLILGQGHNGTVPLEGIVSIEDQVLRAVDVQFDLTDITVTDLEGSSAEKLIDHLMDEDFFDTAQFPAARFELLEPVGLDAESLVFDGNLTIKDTTRPVRLEGSFAEVSDEDGDHYEITGSTEIDRTEWDINFGLVGDHAIEKNIAIEFDIQVPVSAK